MQSNYVKRRCPLLPTFCLRKGQNECNFHLFFFVFGSSSTRDVTERLQLLLRRAGYNFTTSSEREIVRQIKEDV
jgi:hypothetical protein